MIASDAERMFLISGNGDVIEPDEDIIAIGSGSIGARAAAAALMKHSDLSARRIAEESMKITAAICVYTNEAVTIEEL